MYGLTELPERLIVVGSGVTGAEFASAYDALGAEVVLVSSRDRVLPGRGRRRGPGAGGRVRPPWADGAVASRRAAVRDRDGDQVNVTPDRRPDGHRLALPAGGRARSRTPPTWDWPRPGSALDRGGFITVDKVSRTSARGVYAAGDCTGVLMLASVAAMQGRIAMWHALGDAVAPLDLKIVSSQRLHRAGDRHGRDEPGAGRRGRAEGGHRQAAAAAATPGPRCRASATASSRCSACR